MSAVHSLEVLSMAQVLLVSNGMSLPMAHATSRLPTCMVLCDINMESCYT